MKHYMQLMSLNEFTDSLIKKRSIKQVNENPDLIENADLKDKINNNNQIKLNYFTKLEKDLEKVYASKKLKYVPG